MVPLSTLQETFRVDAMGAACLANQVLLEELDCLGNLESLELLVCLVCPVLLQHLHVSLSLRHHANLARKDHLALQDPLAHQEIPASLEHLVALVRMPHQALQAPKDRLDQLEILAQMAHLGTPVFLLKANLFNQAIPAQLETLVHKDHLDPLDSPVEMDNLDLLGQRDPKDQRVHPAPTVYQDLKDQLGHQGHKENGVSVPNIALWTVVSSSRMAQDDKLRALNYGHSYADRIYFLFETASWFVQHIYDHPLHFIITFTALGNPLRLAIMSKLFALLSKLRRYCESLLLLRSNTCHDTFLS